MRSYLFVAVLAVSMLFMPFVQQSQAADAPSGLTGKIAEVVRNGAWKDKGNFGTSAGIVIEIQGRQYVLTTLHGVDLGTTLAARVITVRLLEGGPKATAKVVKTTNGFRGIGPRGSQDLSLLELDQPISSSPFTFDDLGGDEGTKLDQVAVWGLTRLGQTLKKPQSLSGAVRYGTSYWFFPGQELVEGQSGSLVYQTDDDGHSRIEGLVIANVTLRGSKNEVRGMLALTRQAMRIFLKEYLAEVSVTQ